MYFTHTVTLLNQSSFMTCVNTKHNVLLINIILFMIHSFVPSFQFFPNRIPLRKKLCRTEDQQLKFQGLQKSIKINVLSSFLSTKVDMVHFELVNILLKWGHRFHNHCSSVQSSLQRWRFAITQKVSIRKLVHRRSAIGGRGTCHSKAISCWIRIQ